MRGRASVVRRSRKSHIRSPRRVTLAPIELPVRTRNWAIERLALVTIGFWPVMSARSPRAASSAFALVRASPRPMLTTIFESRGTCMRVGVLELLLERRHDLGRVALLEPAGHAFTSSCSPQCRQTRTRRPVVEHRRARSGSGLSQLRADDHDPADRHGLGDVHDAALLDLGHRGRWRSCDWRGLVCRLAMLSPSTTTLDAAGARSRAGTCCGRARRRLAPDDALDLAALAGVLAGEHDDGVALADLGDLGRAGRGGPGGHHSTSGASDTIFM